MLSQNSTILMHIIHQQDENLGKITARGKLKDKDLGENAQSNRQIMQKKETNRMLGQLIHDAQDQ